MKEKILALLGILVVVVLAVWLIAIIDRPPLPVASECYPTGCNGQICADTEVITTCEFRAEYACYKAGRCERQTTGKCGWTETPELKRCFAGLLPVY